MENNSCIIYKDFLPEDFNREIFNHAVAMADQFSKSKVVYETEVGYDENLRKSNHLNRKKFDQIATKFSAILESNFAEICDKLHLELFVKQRTEMQITSHNNGAFFKPHTDRGSGPLATRTITFVYYFHSLPKMFSGGQLLFLANKPKPLIVEAENNSIVFFDSGLLHAVHPISCPTCLFEHSRFTLNGWIHKKEESIV